MAYERGDLRIAPFCHKDMVDGYLCEHQHPTDARGDYSKLSGGVFLPHSCDEWVIGGTEELNTLIADLLDARDKLISMKWEYFNKLQGEEK